MLMCINLYLILSKSLCDDMAQPHHMYTVLLKKIFKNYKKMRYFKIELGFQKACLTSGKYGLSAGDFHIQVKMEILLQDLLRY